MCNSNQIKLIHPYVRICRSLFGTTVFVSYRQSGVFTISVISLFAPLSLRLSSVEFDSSSVKLKNNSLYLKKIISAHEASGEAVISGLDAVFKSPQTCIQSPITDVNARTCDT